MPQSSTHKHIVIIGAGIAGIAAAEAARKQDATCQITVFSKDQEPPYHRVRIADCLRDLELSTKLKLHPEAWYQDREIMLRLGVEVTHIDADAKTVTLASGETVTYDALIVATGSRSFVPPIEGSDHPRVHTLWTLDDAKNLAADITPGTRVAVIGGGLLGLETAWQIHQHGTDVTVLEFLPRLLAKQLDARASALFQERIEAHGISVVTSATTKRIVVDPEDPTLVSGVELDDGTLIEASLVVISAGVRAETGLAAQAGAKMGLRITVDEGQRTSLPDVYAAGDVCEMGDLGTWYGLWMVAMQQGRVAGTNAAGGEAQTFIKAPPYMLNTMDTRICSAGLVQGEAIDGMTTEITDDPEAKTYTLKVYDPEHRLRGFVLLGATEEQNRLLQQIGV